MAKPKKTSVVAFRCDQEVYDQIAARAECMDWSIAHTALYLVKLGLESLVTPEVEEEDSTSHPCYGCDRDACANCHNLHPSMGGDWE